MDQQSVSTSMFEDVHAFHVKVLQQTFPVQPVILSYNFAEERYKFMLEELEEFRASCMVENDLVGATDGLLDLIYVALGTLWYMGIPADEAWKYVQEANMKKKRGITARGNRIDAVKPMGWEGPEKSIAKMIDRLKNENKS